MYRGWALMDTSQFPLEEWNTLSSEEQYYFIASIKAMRHLIAVQERVMKTAVWILVIISLVYIAVLVTVPLPQPIAFVAGGVFVGVWVAVFLLNIFRGGKKK
jgi:sterol desaturase/sphingolipid hydroxylase (fatty acid hydroxylase superfamily)